MSDHCKEEQTQIERARDAAQAKRAYEDLVDNATHAILSMPKERQTYEHYRAEVERLFANLVATSIPWTRAEHEILILADYDPEGSIPAMIAINGVRFTSLGPKDRADEERINKAILLSGPPKAASYTAEEYTPEIKRGKAHPVETIIRRNPNEDQRNA